MRRTSSFFISLSLGLLLAACGGDSPTPGAQDGSDEATAPGGGSETTGGGASETPTDDATTPAGGETGGGGGGAVTGNMCDFVTQQDAETAVGAAVSAGVPTELANLNGCIYTAESGIEGGYVDVKTAPGTAYEALAPQAEELDGLGVPAYFTGSIGAFADIGDDWMQVAVAVPGGESAGGFPTPDREASVTLLTELVGRL